MEIQWKYTIVKKNLSVTGKEGTKKLNTTQHNSTPGHKHSRRGRALKKTLDVHPVFLGNS